MQLFLVIPVSESDETPSGVLVWQRPRASARVSHIAVARQATVRQFARCARSDGGHGARTTKPPGSTTRADRSGPSTPVPIAA